jgi:hyperosmotically inducible periplasmic protein
MILLFQQEKPRMRTEHTAPAGLTRTVLAAATALVLAGPVYAADPEPTSAQADADRAATSELTPLERRATHGRDADSVDLADDSVAAASDRKPSDYSTNSAGERGHQDLATDPAITSLERQQSGGAAYQAREGDDDAFAVNPAAASSERRPADNTAHNERDEDGDKLTPFDQSNDPEDIEITRFIREELVEDEAFGTNAQNIKVITVDGRVTLRGVVESDEEHQRIVAIATEAAGADHVVDELEVIEE